MTFSLGKRSARSLQHLLSFWCLYYNINIKLHIVNFLLKCFRLIKMQCDISEWMLQITFLQEISKFFFSYWIWNESTCWCVRTCNGMETAFSCSSDLTGRRSHCSQNYIIFIQLLLFSQPLFLRFGVFFWFGVFFFWFFFFFFPQGRRDGWTCLTK